MVVNSYLHYYFMFVPLYGHPCGVSQTSWFHHDHTSSRWLIRPLLQLGCPGKDGINSILLNWHSYFQTSNLKFQKWIYIRDHPLMTTPQFSNFLTPSFPLSPHLSLENHPKLPFVAPPSFPLLDDVIYGWSLRTRSMLEGDFGNMLYPKMEIYLFG